MKKVAMIGKGAMTAAMLSAFAQVPIGPSPLYTGRAEPKKMQRIGPPKLSGKRLERLKKQMANHSGG